MDEKETPRDDGRLNLHDESGMTRRDLMRRGAIVGGTLLWVAPAIQSIGSKAYAQTGSPLCNACVQISIQPGNVVVHFNIVSDETCCACLAAAAEAGTAEDIAVATFACVIGGPCDSSDLILGPCT